MVIANLVKGFKLSLNNSIFSVYPMLSNNPPKKALTLGGYWIHILINSFISLEDNLLSFVVIISIADSLFKSGILLKSLMASNNSRNW